MHSLCALAAFVFLLSMSSGAAPGYVRSTTSSSVSSGSATSLQQTSTGDSSEVSELIEYTTPTIARRWIFSVSNKLNRFDASKIKVIDSKGNQVSLAEENRFTHAAGFKAQVSQDLWAFELGIEKSVDSTVFHSERSHLDLSYKLEEKAAQVGVLLTNATDRVPLTYVFDNFLIDSSLKWKPRPDVIDKHRVHTYLEQIWSDNFKNRLEIFHQEQNQERPANGGAQIRNYYVVNSRNSVRCDLGFAADDRRQALSDERGYFQMNWIEGTWQHLMTYDFLVGISYGILQEREDEVRSGLVTQTASDVVGAKLQYSGHNWLGFLTVESLEANTGYKSQRLQGFVQWEI